MATQPTKKPSSALAALSKKKKDDASRGGEVTSREKMKLYMERFEFVKRGREAYQKENFPLAMESYREYLRILADHRLIDMRDIKPAIFDPKKDLAEMMVMSHVYFDLAKIYDRVPNLVVEFNFCLNQFVNFTLGKKYQTANFNSYRRYLLHKRVRHKKEFEVAYKQLLVESKKCYIATYCFGKDHRVTAELRLFKKHFLALFRLGTHFIDMYYQYSPQLIRWCERHPRTGLFLKYAFFRPLLYSLLPLVLSVKPRKVELHPEL